MWYGTCHDKCHSCHTKQKSSTFYLPSRISVTINMQISNYYVGNTNSHFPYTSCSWNAGRCYKSQAHDTTLLWICAYLIQGYHYHKKNTFSYFWLKGESGGSPLHGVSWGAGTERERGLVGLGPLTWAVVGRHAHGGDGGRAGGGVGPLPIPLNGWRRGYKVILWPSILQKTVRSY